MAEECALDGVLEGGVPGELVDFADVVKDDAGEEQVALEDGVVGATRSARRRRLTTCSRRPPRKA